MSSFDLVTAMWMRKKQKNTVILKDTPPLSFKASSTKLKDYAIYGNDGGAGDFDSTTEKYLIPVTVRRQNLFDISNYELVAMYPEQQTGTATASTGSKSRFRSLLLPVVGGKTYSICVKRGNIDRFRLAAYTNYPPEDGDECILSPDGTIENNYAHVVFTAPEGATSVLLYLFSSLLPADIDALITSEAIELQFCESSSVVYFEKHTTTIVLDEPLGAGDCITMSDTGQQIDVIRGENTLTVDTTIQPAKVTIKYYGGGL